MADVEKIKDALAKKRAKQAEADDTTVESHPVSLGAVGEIVDALINTTPEKLLEITNFDRNQVLLIPQVLVTTDMWDYLKQIMAYRSNKADYAKDYKTKKLPEMPNTAAKFVHILAQCRRSLDGKTQKDLTDLALADLERKAVEEGANIGADNKFEDS